MVVRNASSVLARGDQGFDGEHVGESGSAHAVGTLAASYASAMQPVRDAEPAHDEGTVDAGGPARPSARPPAEPVPQRGPGWYRRAVVLAIVAALGVPAVDGALWLQERPRTPAGTSGASVPRPSPTQVQSGTNGAPSTDALPSTAAVADLLERRSRAVTAGDRRAWLATVDPTDAALVHRQGDLFDRLSALRPTIWSYALQAPDAVLPPARKASLGAGAFLAHVRLAYRLAPGVGEVQRDQHLTLVQREGHWVVGGDQDGSQQRDLWDLGPITVARGSRSVVVTGRGAPVPAKRTAAEADAAARSVDLVWGADWPRWVVVLVPGTLQEMATLLDRTAMDGLSQLAAVTTGELRTGALTRGRTTGDRVVVNPVAFRGLSAVGRAVVLTHELTHVATRADDISAPPVWVDEGFADYVAYLRAPLPVRDVAGDLLNDRKALAALRDLPADRAFDPAAGQVGPAYAAAWLAMRFVAEQGGTPMVVDFYRVAAGLPALHTWPKATPARASLTPRTPLEHACADVVGYSEPSFVRRWLVYVRTR
jgi:hypothetical protein